MIAILMTAIILTFFTVMLWLAIHVIEGIEQTTYPAAAWPRWPVLVPAAFAALFWLCWIFEW